MLGGSWAWSSSLETCFTFSALYEGLQVVRRLAYRESNFSMSAWEYEAPMTVAGLPEPCRGATGRFRQKGDADLLQMSKFNAETTFVGVGVHTRSGLHIPKKLAGVNTTIIATFEATFVLQASHKASLRVCGTDRPEPFPEPVRSVNVSTWEAFVTYLLLQGLFVRHDGQRLSPQLDSQNSRASASQLSRDTVGLHFKGLLHSSYEAPLSVSGHSTPCR
jgi:hypothetical protein